MRRRQRASQSDESEGEPQPLSSEDESGEYSHPEGEPEQEGSHEEEEEEDAEGYEEEEEYEEEEGEEAPIEPETTKQDIQEVRGQDETKVNDPSRVPKSGRFFMHDDRNAGPKESSTEGQKVWEEDEGTWVHDKFSALDVGSNSKAFEGPNQFRGRRRRPGENSKEDENFRKPPRGSVNRRGSDRRRRGDRNQQVTYRKVDSNREKEIQQEPSAPITTNPSRRQGSSANPPSYGYKPKQKIEYRPKHVSSSSAATELSNVPTVEQPKQDLGASPKVVQPKTTQKRYSSQREAQIKKSQPANPPATNSVPAAKTAPIHYSAANAVPFTPKKGSNSSGTSTFVPKKGNPPVSAPPISNPPVASSEQESSISTPEQTFMPPLAFEQMVNMQSYPLIQGMPYMHPNFVYPFQYPPQYYPMMMPDVSGVSYYPQYSVFGYDQTQMYGQTAKSQRNPQNVKKMIPPENTKSQWIQREKKSHAIPIMKPPGEPEAKGTDISHQNGSAERTEGT